MISPKLYESWVTRFTHNLDMMTSLIWQPIRCQYRFVVNLAFDVTPAKYVTGLITEKGICEASSKGLKNLFDK